MTYEQFITPYLGPHFAYGELVSGTTRKKLPPQHLWHAMVPTLAVANDLRRLIGLPLRVQAAYRPEGGARRSAHKRNAALDLDILSQDPEIKAAWYRLTVEYWRQSSAPVGMGHYVVTPSSTSGIRVHIDTTGRRSWTHCGGKALPVSLCQRLS